ncbi:hypothetical protein ILYODFUR_003361 [Ilyodon furcidens]|uniref:Uncharacterized protein n=1 Tax=Ilyodon furcidens TaxID=33524 RepID=A0ABV0VAP2_9TELE
MFKDRSQQSEQTQPFACSPTSKHEQYFSFTHTDTHTKYSQRHIKSEQVVLTEERRQLLRCFCPDKQVVQHSQCYQRTQADLSAIHSGLKTETNSLQVALQSLSVFIIQPVMTL